MTDYAVDLPTRRSTIRLSRAIARTVQPRDLWVLAGPLGAGKTFLVRAVCRALGLDRALRVTSPTFTLVHEYPTTPPVVHADLYRLRTIEEGEALGLAEQREDGKVLFVEWGADHLSALGGDAVVIELSLEPRTARIRATGPVSAARARALAENRGLPAGS